MKKVFIIIAASITVITGCTKKLDINPTQDISDQEVFTSDANIKAALNGAYDAISNSYLLGGDFQLYSELLAADGEIRWAGTYNQPREIFSKSILTNNSFVTNTWTAGYNTINICNNILNAIDKVNTADQDRVKGEALFLRGLTYFEMAELFAKPYSDGNASSNLGLQLITTPTSGGISDANYVPRSTLQETYNLILSDLTEAKGLLPDDNDVYANSFTASAVLSRVYLQMGDYANARDEANNVITNSSYSLTTTYAEAFNRTSNSSEDIFAIQVTAQDGANDMQVFWSIPQYGARDGDVDVLQKHINLYDPADDRLKLFYLDGQNIYRSGKWKLQYRNLPIIRLAEMYLTRAECNFRLGTTVGATPDDDINNVIRKRVNLSPTTITLDNILLERKLELAHEGQRIQDVKRLKLTVDGFDYDANELVLPIPIREINASNGALQQNDGY
ncbi:MAG TPA: RagB/SusD family nutrient uptake outer membrane protein [Chitinophagaceae bacterium]|nr:RagB/SusD family nutrient uptake outer membrane protein [Chitinophagaceae bacterium]